MSYQLCIVAGPETGRVFRLENGQKLSIGRGQQSDTKINDSYMSRIHCTVSIDGSTTKLTDGGGKNTLVRGTPIDSHDLKPGDEFQAGTSVFRFMLGDISDEQTMRGTMPVSPAKPAAAPTPLPAKTPALKDLVGHTFVHYRLDSILAMGATGYVFKGTDTEKNRPIAVKVLFPERTSNEEERDRFIRAMKTMLPIKHPNLVRLYNAGKSGPFCWVAMEFVDGENLTNIIERFGAQGMLDWREVWKVAVDITSALQTAYEEKVIHRNVTPTNILRRNADKVCLLGDLMLAKACEGTLAKQVTSPGSLVGDLAYMSPERTRDGNTVDGRSDIYGLGATLYALVAGRPPFQSESLTDLIRSIREAEPVRPKKYQLSIHDQFEDIILRMLAKRPEDRYENPSALLKDLERVGRFQGLAITSS